MKDKHYDYLFVGAGLFNAVLAQRASEMGFSCLVIDKRNTIAGNCYTENWSGITVHKYGAHIFHTSDKEVWDYVNRFTKFNGFVNSPVAISWDKEVYNMPFNMNTFSKLFGVATPAQARQRIQHEISQYKFANGYGDSWKPSNLEEQAISMVGTTIYERLVKEYTEKQWNAKCDELPADIIKRLPLRFTYDNNYFNDKYQGIPVDGYTEMIAAMLDGCDIELNVDFLHNDEVRERYTAMADHVFYSGRIDEYFGYEYGPLEYRSLRFDEKCVPIEHGQGNAVVNYTGAEKPYTRTIEHRFFNPEREYDGSNTIITTEYPDDWTVGREPYYPVNNDQNNAIYRRYAAKAECDTKVEFVGRLGLYQYLDMDKVVRKALDWNFPARASIWREAKEFLKSVGSCISGSNALSEFE